MKEAEFWRALRRHMPPGLLIRRIEDASGNLGTWDTFLACHGRAAWLELKVAGPAEKPRTRPGQAAFGAALFDAGIPALYLVGSATGTMRAIGPLMTTDTWREHLVDTLPIDGQGAAKVLELLGLSHSG